MKATAMNYTLFSDVTATDEPHLLMFDFKNWFFFKFTMDFENGFSFSWFYLNCFLTLTTKFNRAHSFSVVLISN